LLALDVTRRACHSAIMIELTQEFAFDAAHRLEQGDSQNARLHGHSFYVEVTLRGEVDPALGWLRDFAEIGRALDAVKRELDHRFLNEVEGLGKPTLENIARYVFERARPALPEIARVQVRRPSCGQSCSYEPKSGR